MRRALFVIAAICALVQILPQTTASAEDQVWPKVVASELDNPTGVAVQPKTGHVLICARPGIFRYVPGTPSQVTKEVTGFSTDVYGKGPKYNIGPLGLAFLDANHIVVGDGSQKDGAELVRIYKIAAWAAQKPQSAKDAVHTLGPITAGDASVKGEGNYYGVAINDHGVFLTSNGDDTKGWIAHIAIDGGMPSGPLTPMIPSKPATSVDAPVAITNSPDGKSLVVGQMGEMNVPNDSLLTMYNPASGELTMKAKTGLSDISGLAYSPKTGKLYAVDFSWIKPEDGGLFRLDVEGDAVKAVKVASLSKPTALAFDADGALYITGDLAPINSTKLTGKLWKVEPGL